MLFTDMARNLICEACEKGQLYYDQAETMDAWTQPEVFKLDDVDKLIDGVISEVLIFKCNMCESAFRFTFKEVEKKFRKQLSKIILTMIAMGQRPDPGTMRKENRIFIYCGKCGGVDGKGGCIKHIYDGCDLKRLPDGL